MKLKGCKLSIFMLLVIIFAIFSLNGCKETYENNQKVKLAYFGNSYELPLITAFEEGYFEKEGLDVELVKLNYDDFSSSINNKTIDGGTCDYRILKSIEDGTEIKLGAGLHSGSIEVLVKNGSEIAKINDLKNKKIGIQNQGEGTMILAKSLFNKYSINSLNDITWINIEGNQLKNSLRDGSVDAVILWQSDEVVDDEFTTLYKATDVNSVVKSGHSHHGDEFYYISFAGVSKELADTCPQKTAGILRAWIAGANKVAEDKEWCLNKAIDDKYIQGSFEENYQEIKQYMWMPSVKYAKDNLKSYIGIQKSVGILQDSLNEDEFYNDSFADVLPYWD